MRLGKGLLMLLGRFGSVLPLDAHSVQASEDILNVMAPFSLRVKVVYPQAQRSSQNLSEECRDRKIEQIPFVQVPAGGWGQAKARLLGR